MAGPSQKPDLSSYVYSFNKATSVFLLNASTSLSLYIHIYIYMYIYIYIYKRARGVLVGMALIGWCHYICLKPFGRACVKQICKLHGEGWDDRLEAGIFLFSLMKCYSDILIGAITTCTHDSQDLYKGKLKAGLCANFERAKRFLAWSTPHCIKANSLVIHGDPTNDIRCETKRRYALQLRLPSLESRVASLKWN